MRRLPLILLLLALSACEGDMITNIVPTAPCTPPAVEARLIDLIVGDGLGDVQGTDTTPEADSWLWTVNGCTPVNSERPVYTGLCNLSPPNTTWQLTTCRDGCCGETSGSTPVS